MTGGFRSVLCVSVFQGSLLLKRRVFEKRSKFYLGSKFFFYLLYTETLTTLDFQGGIVPIVGFHMTPLKFKVQNYLSY